MKRTGKRLTSLITALLLTLILLPTLAAQPAFAVTTTESESNDTLETANLISPNYQVTGALSTSSDADWFCFTLSKDGMVSVTFGHEYIDSSYNYWGTSLYTAGNEELTSASWAGNTMTEETSCEVGLPAGTYYLRIKRANNVYYSWATYHFTLNYTASDAWEKEQNDTIVTACTAALNKQISGSLMRSDDADWYKFTLQEDDTLVIVFSHEYIDSSYRYWGTSVYSSENVELKYERWSGNVTDGSFEIPLSAGTYYLRVKRDNNVYHSWATYSFVLRTTKPDAPTLQASASGESVSLSWNSVYGATKYALYRREYGDSWSSWSPVKTSLTGTSYTDGSVVAGTKYQYRIKAYNGVWGDYSTAVTVTVKSKLAITTQPKNYVGAVGSTATATVKATGDGLSYQWYFANPGATSFTKSGSKTATYSATLTVSNSGRRLYCIITDA